MSRPMDHTSRGHSNEPVARSSPVTNVYVRHNQSTEEMDQELSTTPRSRSGLLGSFRRGGRPHQHHLSAGGESLEASSEEVSGSPRKSNAFWEAFRPRSKSDSKSARNIITPPTVVIAGHHDMIPVPDASSQWPKSRSVKGHVGSMMDKLRKQRSQSGSKMDTSQLSPAQLQGKPRHISAGTPTAEYAQVGTPSAPSPKRAPLLPQGSLDSCQRSMQKINVAESFLGSNLGFLTSEEDRRMVYRHFVEQHKCYDLIPTSTKVVVFDTELLVKKAFYALVYNGVRAAPLWDSSRQEFVGMLTITDFINILRKYHSSGQGINQQLEEEKICSWKNFEDESNFNFISIDVNQNLLEAVEFLCLNKVHRLPVVNRITGNVLYILTHKRILRFLHLYKKDFEAPKYMLKRPQELGIGSWGEIKTVTRETLLIDALAIFANYRVSALPVVDEEGRVVDIYAKFDVIHLAAEKAYNRLDVPLKDILKLRGDWFEGVHYCLDTDNLQDVVEKLVNAEVHRIVVVDSDQRVKGILSLSDILRFLVLEVHERPAESMEFS